MVAGSDFLSPALRRHYDGSVHPNMDVAEVCVRSVCVESVVVGVAGGDRT